jgi:hypothetical protein
MLEEYVGLKGTGEVSQVVPVRRNTAQPLLIGSGASEGVIWPAEDVSEEFSRMR